MTQQQLPPNGQTSTPASPRDFGRIARNLAIAFLGVALIVVATALTTAALMPRGANAGQIVGSPVELPVQPGQTAAATSLSDPAAGGGDQSQQAPSAAPVVPAPSGPAAPAAPASSPLAVAGGHHGAASGLISEEQAKQIALARVPGATSIRLHFSHDDGHDQYEGEIIHESTEHDFEIDAVTGEILEWESEHVGE